MHFAVSFTTLLASVTLLSTVASSPINAKLGRRGLFDDDDEIDDDDLEDLEVDGEEVESLSDLCSESADKLKRHLEARATLPPQHLKVEVGKADALDTLPFGLWTDYLVTCTGVVVIGKKSGGGGGSGRALAHIAGTKAILGDEWDTFKEKVDKMKLSDKKGFMSSPLLSDSLPDGWNDDLSDNVKATTANIKERLEKLVDDSNIVQRFHRMKDSMERKGDNGVMSVNAQNVVFIDGDQVS
ncbi:MAG: hypothetical protein LQ348_005763 [Seirophora lacunosa]|nr:MAG: hypothetical protein LQ344_005109 [Seirophora lacunosa]KAI4177857.1 MAG: hypothetical protein LQ348_005763 [Seirophora lacunosa]